MKASRERKPPPNGFRSKSRFRESGKRKERKTKGMGHLGLWVLPSLVVLYIPLENGAEQEKKAGARFAFSTLVCVAVEWQLLFISYLAYVVLTVLSHVYFYGTLVRKDYRIPNWILIGWIGGRSWVLLSSETCGDHLLQNPIPTTFGDEMGWVKILPVGSC